MKTFGLIGYPLSHSFSPGYFAKKFEREAIENCSYKAFEIASIEMFKTLCAEQDLSGLNVTIPYKEAVIPFLDSLDETAETVGAVNTIAFIDGQTRGYNTDVIGFQHSIQPFLKDHHKRAFVLGTGGAAKAVEYIMKNLGLEVQYVSRKASDKAISYDQMSIEYGDVIINSTPLGMHPKIDTCPNIPYEALNESHLLYDLVYNPEVTLFLQKGQAQGASIKNGMDMLHLQAEAAWVIWNQSSY